MLLVTMLVCHGLIAAGVVYDVVVAPPSSGQFVDGAGMQRALPMRLGRANLNKQYLIEVRHRDGSRRIALRIWMHMSGVCIQDSLMHACARIHAHFLIYSAYTAHVF